MSPRQLALALCLMPFAATPALAQGMGGVAKNGFSPPVQGVGQKPVVREAPPPGLPGAESRDTKPNPEQIPLDMAPTEALFDAINRGDMAEARDALGRGADLSGRNVLGMTPIDLSVDLGRSDITFLLLSLRTQTAVGGGPVKGPVASVTAIAPTRKKVANAHPPRPVLVREAESRPVRYASVPAPAVPQAGFLGFGPTASP